MKFLVEKLWTVLSAIVPSRGGGSGVGAYRQEIGENEDATVHFQVQCDMIPLQDNAFIDTPLISTPALTDYTARIIQDTFNQIHREIDGRTLRQVKVLSTTTATATPGPPSSLSSSSSSSIKDIPFSTVAFDIAGECNNRCLSRDYTVAIEHAEQDAWELELTRAFGEGRPGPDPDQGRDAVAAGAAAANRGSPFVLVDDCRVVDWNVDADNGKAHAVIDNDAVQEDSNNNNAQTDCRNGFTSCIITDPPAVAVDPLADTVSYAPHLDKDDSDDVDMPIVPVTMTVKCGDVDLIELPPSYAVNALENTYNQVYEPYDGAWMEGVALDATLAGTAVLFAATLHHNADPATAAKDGGRDGTSIRSENNPDPNDADDLVLEKLVMEMTAHQIHTTWEELFAARIFLVDQSVQDCQIQVEVTGVTGVTEPEPESPPKQQDAVTSST